LFQFSAALSSDRNAPRCRFRAPSARFNSQPPFLTAVTAVTSWSVSKLSVFQFSAALSSGCNQRLSSSVTLKPGVSILSRPLERLQRRTAAGHKSSTSFNSQPPSRAAATTFQNRAYLTLRITYFARTSARGGSIHESIGILIFKERFVGRCCRICANRAGFRPSLEVRAEWRLEGMRCPLKCTAYG
jgi:hypothetical protein